MLMNVNATEDRDASEDAMIQMLHMGFNTNSNSEWDLLFSR